MLLLWLHVAALVFMIACNSNRNRLSMDSDSSLPDTPVVDTSAVGNILELANGVGWKGVISRLDTTMLDRKHFSFSTKMRCGDYWILLVSYCYDDTLDDRWVMYGDRGWPIVQKQVLVFKMGDDEIRKHVLPLRTKTCITRRGESVQCLVADVAQLCFHKASECMVEAYGSEPGTGMEIPLFEGIYGFDGSIRFEGYLGGNMKNEDAKIDQISHVESGLPDTCKRMVCIHCQKVEVPIRAAKR